MTAPRTKPVGQLPSLIAPHYFSGQLLSDRDLDALVGWARARLSLGGRRDGFGVVSGLELRVDPRSGHEADLIVGPGYAVGPAGEDIVVATEETLSLADFVPGPSNDPTARHPADVFIGAAQVRQRPQPGFDYGDENDESGSTYSRVSERFKLTTEPAANEDPERAAVRTFEDHYDNCLAPLREFRSWMVENDPGPDRIREWLRSRLLGTEFRFAAYDLDECSSEELREERTAVRALFWLVQHARNAFLSSFATGDQRVRIGRVWLWAAGDSTPRTIVALDGHRPYRRWLSDRGLPAPPGWVNATDVIWEREVVAHLALAQRGIRCHERRTLELPHRLDELETALMERLMLRPDEQVSLLVYRHAPFGRRVVGVLPERELEVFVEVEVETNQGHEAEPGDEVTEVFQVPPEPDVLGTAVVVRNGEEENRIPLTVGEEITVGHEGALIETDDDTEDFELDAFRRHGVLRVQSDRVLLVVTSRIRLDLNGERVRDENRLEHGDVIKIGRTEIRIELEA